MAVKQWMVNLKKSAGPKKPHVPPGIAQVAAVSVVVLLAVGAIIVVAQKATPAATASPAKAVTTTASATPAKPAATTTKGTPAKGKTANSAGSAQAAPEIVTITGCLEQKDDGFRLKDTEGTDAPKSRSWKTLGLTKHASTISLIDTSHRLKLGTHVGQRVSVTGALVDKDLQGKSLKSLSPSCE